MSRNEKDSMLFFLFVIKNTQLSWSYVVYHWMAIYMHIIWYCGWLLDIKLPDCAFKKKQRVELLENESSEP